MQMMVFVCLVMGPCIPIAQFIGPVGCIYSFGYWAVYLLAPEKNVSMQEAGIQFVTYAALAVFVAYFQQSSVLRT
jgi:hypothetical protein